MADSININPTKGAAEFPNTVINDSPNSHTHTLSSSSSTSLQSIGVTSSSAVPIVNIIPSNTSTMTSSTHLGDLPSIKGLKICCIGAGYVGGPTMAMIAQSK